MFLRRDSLRRVACDQQGEGEDGPRPKGDRRAEQRVLERIEALCAQANSQRRLLESQAKADWLWTYVVGGGWDKEGEREVKPRNEEEDHLMI